MANPDTTPLTIALESPRQPEIVALIAALDQFNDGLYPPEASYLLSLDELDVPDPYYGSTRHFEQVYELVDRSCRGLLAALTAPGQAA